MSFGGRRTHRSAMEGPQLDREFLRFRDEGAPEALARVFDVLAPRLLLIAGHLARDAASAEDLVQTTFLHAIRDAERYDGRRPVAAWLAGILRHRAVDLRRREERRRGVSIGGEADVALARDGSERASGSCSSELAMTLDPAELAADAELYRRAVEATLALAEPYRAVLVLRVVHGLAPIEIARALGRRPATVRAQLERGLAKLRRAVPSTGIWLAFEDGAAGLAPVRRAALEAAARRSASLRAPSQSDVPSLPSTTAGAAPVLAGALVMKPLVSALVTVALALLLALVWRASDGPRPAAGALAGTPAPREAGGEQRGATPPAPAVRPERVAEDAAPEEPAPGAGAQLEVQVLFAGDGAPARDVGVYLRASGDGGLGVETRTDAAGIAVLAPTEGGRYELHVDRRAAPVELRWPEEQRLSISIPAGIFVEGRVVDLAGAGVAGALVLRRNARHHDVLQHVAVAGQDGAFALRDVAEELELLARAPGHQPSELERVRGGGAGVARLELRLGASGHPLRGRVLRPGGAPAPHAWVLVGVDEGAREAPEGSTLNPQERAGFKPMDLEGILLRADAAGRFESDEIPGGHALVVARAAPGDAEESALLVGWSTRWMPGRAGDELFVQLRPGAEVAGRVRAPSGAPVAGVAVEAEWEGTNALGQMEDELGPFVSDRRVLTDADGAFVLAGLLPGDYDLRVRGAREELALDQRVLREDERAVWDPVVEPPAALEVRLSDPEGTPLVGWRVAADDEMGRDLFWLRTEETDVGGRALLRDLPRDRELVVAAFPPLTELPAAVRAGVGAADSAVLELRLAPHEAPSASLRGRLVTGAGRTASGARVELLREGWSGRWRQTVGEDGRFGFEALAPGELRLRATAATSARGVELGVRAVARGEALDVGDLVLEEAAGGT